VLLVRLDSRARRSLALVLTLIAAAWLAKEIASPGIAEYLAQDATSVVELERALAWDPRNPGLHLRLAQAHLTALEQGKLGEARRHLEAALLERPSHAGTWLRLALLADRQRDMARARQALATALRTDPRDVRLRWEAALLSLRWGEREQALDHFRYVLAVDPTQRDAAFQLAMTLLRPGESAASLLPQEAESLTGLLAAAVRHQDLVLAEAAWERRAPLTPAIPAGIQRAYLELLLREGRGRAARRLWLALVPNRQPEVPGNGVWNGGFEADRLLGWGFDWQIRRVWGVEVTLDRFVAARGRQSLRLAFNSFPTLDFSGVFQTVAVEPGRDYALRAFAKALDFSTRSGLKLQVVTADDQERVLAETAAIAQTTADWVPLETRVHVPANTSLLRVRLRREKAPGPEGNLGGKVWLDEVSLTPIGSASSRLSLEEGSG
jgi:tetratricopeptide (TPR) repeat protein